MTFTKYGTLAAIGLTAILALAGCKEDTSETASDTQARATRVNVDDWEGTIINQCLATGSLTRSECVGIVPEVIEDMDDRPSYALRESCEGTFGPGGCEQTDLGMFVPLIAGFVALEVADEIGDALRKRKPKVTAGMAAAAGIAAAGASAKIKSTPQSRAAETLKVATPVQTGSKTGSKAAGADISTKSSAKTASQDAATRDFLTTNTKVKAASPTKSTTTKTTTVKKTTSKPKVSLTKKKKYTSSSSKKKKRY